MMIIDLIIKSKSSYETEFLLLTLHSFSGNLITSRDRMDIKLVSM